VVVLRVVVCSVVLVVPCVVLFLFCVVCVTGFSSTEGVPSPTPPFGCIAGVETINKPNAVLVSAEDCKRVFSKDFKVRLYVYLPIYLFKVRLYVFLPIQGLQGASIWVSICIYPSIYTSVYSTSLRQRLQARLFKGLQGTMMMMMMRRYAYTSIYLYFRI